MGNICNFFFFLNKILDGIIYYKLINENVTIVSKWIEVVLSLLNRCRSRDSSKLLSLKQSSRHSVTNFGGDEGHEIFGTDHKLRAPTISEFQTSFRTITFLIIAIQKVVNFNEDIFREKYQEIFALSV
ncbi:hypothetical protein PUN28_002525 [Cardiocondyla obscurior]|uniref:Uncharacterized protein n=1 Tax=Cardiocondyla obscurior TaxID=286306 RepID=A0AAW2GUR8_9HYME